jgi:hypothetical protein
LYAHIRSDWSYHIFMSERLDSKRYHVLDRDDVQLYGDRIIQLPKWR